MRRAAALLACLTLFAEFCAAQPAEVADKPDIRPGDWWIYRRINYITNQTVDTYDLQVTYASGDVILGVVTPHKDGEGAPRVAGVPTFTKREGQTDGVWTSEWNVVSSPDGAVYKTHSGTYRFPLRSGMRYESQYEFHRPREGARGQRGRHAIHVGDWEMVTVPAGTFRALKVEERGPYVNLHDGKGGVDIFTCWYSPEVKRPVKCVYQTDPGKPYALHRGQELINFGGGQR